MAARRPAGRGDALRRDDPAGGLSLSEPSSGPSGRCPAFRSPTGTGTLRPPPANWLPCPPRSHPPAKGVCHPERSEGSRRIRRALTVNPPGGGRSFAALRMTEEGAGGQREKPAEGGVTRQGGQPPGTSTLQPRRPPRHPSQPTAHRDGRKPKGGGCEMRTAQDAIRWRKWEGERPLFACPLTRERWAPAPEKTEALPFFSRISPRSCPRRGQAPCGPACQLASLPAAQSPPCQRSLSS